MVNDSFLLLMVFESFPVRRKSVEMCKVCKQGYNLVLDKFCVSTVASFKL